MGRLGERWDRWVDEFNSATPRTGLGRYFGLWDARDQEVGDDETEPSRAEQVIDGLWLVAAILIATVVGSTLDVDSLPTPVDFIVWLAIAAAAGVALAILREVAERVVGNRPSS